MADQEIDDAESIRRRREMDDLLNNRYRDSKATEREYDEWISTIQFKSETDKHVFDKLPLSLKEKMEMLKAVLKENETESSSQSS